MNISYNNSLPTFNKAVHPVLEWIACLLLGFSVSSLVVKFNIILVGRNLIEPYVIASLIVLSFSNGNLFSFFKRTLSSQFMIISLLILFLMVIMGFLTGTSTAYSTTQAISSIYSEFRSIFIFVFFICFSKIINLPIGDIDRLVTKFFISLIVFDVLSVTVFNNLQYDYFAEATRSSVICIAPLFLMGRALIAERVIPALICLSIITVFTVIALMRLNYVYVFLALIMLIYFSIRFLGSLRTSYKTFILIISAVAIAILSIPLAMEYFQSNGARLIHGLYRFQELFGYRDTMFSEVETARVGANKIILLEMDKFIIPQGLGAINHTPRVMSLFRDSYGVLSTADSSFLYCIYHFGLFLGTFIICSIFYVSIKYIFEYMRLSDKRTLFTTALYILSFLVLFSLKSWTFMYWSTSMQYAILLPWMFKYKEFSNYYCSIYNIKN